MLARRESSWYFYFSVVGGISIAFVYFWLFNLPFAILDFTRPAWAEVYRVQDDKKVQD